MNKSPTKPEPISYHLYDINIIGAITRLEEIAREKQLTHKPDGLELREYFHRLWSFAEYYYNSLSPDDPFRQHSFAFLRKHGALTVYSNLPVYQMALTLDLASRHASEVPMFLDYQEKSFIGYMDIQHDQFMSLVEFLVLPHLRGWSITEDDATVNSVSGWIQRKHELSEIDKLNQTRIDDLAKAAGKELGEKLLIVDEKILRILNGVSRIEKKSDQILAASNKSNNTGKKKTEEALLPFKEIFCSQAAFDKAMGILSDAKLIDPDTYIWIDINKSRMSVLAAIIKDLHGKGYYKIEIKIKAHYVQHYASDFFRLEISYETAKRANPSKIEIPPFPPFKDESEGDLT